MRNSIQFASSMKRLPTKSFLKQKLLREFLLRINATEAGNQFFDVGTRSAEN
jgi:hypothetical protein